MQALTKMLELGFTISMKDESRYMKEVFVRAMSVPMKKAMGTTTRSIFRSSAPLPPPPPRAPFTSSPSDSRGSPSTQHTAVAAPLCRNWTVRQSRGGLAGCGRCGGLTMWTHVTAIGNGNPWPRGGALKSHLL